MKFKTIARVISFILLPIFFLSFICSILFLVISENKTDENQLLNEEKFLSLYMGAISDYANSLIFYNEGYSSIDDGDNIICYNQGEYVYSTIQNLKFIIIYKNKALTNLELTLDTDTIDEIKNIIENSEQKKTFILNGNIQSDTEVLAKKAIKYYDNFKFKYYKTENLNENYDFDLSENETSQPQNVVNHYETSIEDFDIYTSYDEVIIERDDFEFIFSQIGNFEQYKNIFYIVLPSSIILFLLTLIILTYCIGDKKDSDNYNLNMFDKIWFEIILTVVVIIGAIGIVPLAVIFDYIENNNNINLLVSVFLGTYFAEYIICALLYNTFIKRIKAKSFLTTSFFGKVFIFTKKIIRKFIYDLKENINNFKINSSKRKRIFIFALGIFVCEIFVFAIFDIVGSILFNIILLGYCINKFIKILTSYEKIENKLRDMYEGKNDVDLEIEKIDDNFKDVALYINDISSGFDNAIQNSIKSEKLKTELITNVSHDIKTPLTSIINYVDLLKKENMENKKANEYIEVLDNKSQRLKKLIDDLIEASKASSGTIKLNLEKLNIVELLNQAIGEFKDKFEAKELTIITKSDSSEIYINGDSRYLYRVIENLFSNISKYSLEKSRVYIDLIESNDFVEIDIKNISKESLNISSDELMQRFVRGDKSRTTEGSGLGISIAKSLTELQGGMFNLSIDGDLFRVEIRLNK